MTRALVSLFVLVAAGAAAEPVVTIRTNGPSANRIDFVILGDGYTSRELLKFASDVDRLIGPLLQRPPFAEYAAYFNVHRVDLISPQSGVDHPERRQFRDTALNATYTCGGFVQLICVDHALVHAVLDRSVAADQRDVILVLVNDAQYGGGGGPIATASTDPIGTVNLVLHELGHTIGLLGDEYVEIQCRTPPDRERAEPNITAVTDRDAIKWKAWIADDTPVPTEDPVPSLVGLYRGAQNCAHLHRPTYNSMMRTPGMPFEAVNTEQLIRRFYNFVSPIDDAAPAEEQIRVQAGTPAHFSVVPLQPASHDLEIRWTVDGAPAGRDATLALSLEVRSRPYLVEVEVRDTTDAVRHDPRQALVERRMWMLGVESRE
jgi:hypothetical protein